MDPHRLDRDHKFINDGIFLVEIFNNKERDLKWQVC